MVPLSSSLGHDLSIDQDLYIPKVDLVPDDWSVENTEKSPFQTGYIAIRWSWISITLSVVTIGSLATLVVVVSVQNVDTLSTVALALAVLAFAAQLIVSLAQGISGAQQLAQAERINAGTQSALSSLRSATDALLSTQKEQFNQVLSFALSRAVPQAIHELSETDSSEAPVQDQQALGDAIIQRVEELIAPIASRVSQGLPRSALAMMAAAAEARPEGLPAHRLAAAKEALSQLTKDQLLLLGRAQRGRVISAPGDSDWEDASRLKELGLLGNRSTDTSLLPGEPEIFRIRILGQDVLRIVWS